jgi:hypothetical protein
MTLPTKNKFAKAGNPNIAPPPGPVALGSALDENFSNCAPLINIENYPTNSTSGIALANVAINNGAAAASDQVRAGYGLSGGGSIGTNPIISAGDELAGLAALGTPNANGYVYRSAPGTYEAITFVGSGGITLTQTGSTLTFSGGGGGGGLVVSGSGAPTSANVEPSGVIYEATSTGNLYVSKTGLAGNPTVVQVITTATTDATVTFVSPPTNGNLMLAFVASSGAAPPANSGWTFDRSLSQYFQNANIYYRYAGASESSTQQITSTNAGEAYAVWELTNVSSTYANVIDVVNAFGYNSTSISDGGWALTSTGNDELFLLCINGGGGTPGFSIATSYTIDLNANGILQLHGAVPSSGTTPSFTANSTSGFHNLEAIGILIKNAGTTQSWYKFGPTAVKQSGTTIDNQLSSLNFDASFSTSTDGSGNITVSAAAGSGLVILGAGAPVALEPEGTLYEESTTGDTWQSVPGIGPNHVGIVQYTLAGMTGSVSAINVLPSPPTVGNLLVALATHNTNSPTLQGGWTQIEANNAAGDGAFMAYRIVQPGDTATFTWLTGTGEGLCAIYELNNQNGSGFIVNHAHTGTFQTGTFTPPFGITTVGDQEMALTLCAVDGSTTGGPYTPDVTWSTDVNFTTSHDNRMGFIGHKEYLSAGSTVQYTTTTSGNGNYLALAVTIKPVYNVGTPGWLKMSRLTTIKNASGNVTTGALSLKFVGSDLSSVTDDGLGNITVDISAGGGSAGAMVLIQEQALVAPTSTVSFSGIANTYRDLRLVVRGRQGASSIFTLQFNGDTAADYDWQNVSLLSTGTTVNQAFAATAIQCAWIGSSADSANEPGIFDGYIYNYKGTTFDKVVRGQGATMGSLSAGTFGTGETTGNWRSTAAITSMLLTAGAGQFAAGSVISLYGVM